MKYTKEEIESLTVRALDTTSPLAYKAMNRVGLIGKRLCLPIHWKGRQWAVTSYGVEARDGTYSISRDRLWEENRGYGWVHHMATKDWVDLPDFAEALRLGRALWPRWLKHNSRG